MKNSSPFKLVDNAEASAFKRWLQQTPPRQQSGPGFRKWWNAQGAFDQKPKPRRTVKSPVFDLAADQAEPDDDGTEQPVQGGALGKLYQLIGKLPDQERAAIGEALEGFLLVESRKDDAAEDQEPPSVEQKLRTFLARKGLSGDDIEGAIKAFRAGRGGDQGGPPPTPGTPKVGGELRAFDSKAQAFDDMLFSSAVGCRVSTTSSAADAGFRSRFGDLPPVRFV
jgi:hypothetical protein